MRRTEAHWTSGSETSLMAAIAFDFLAQIGRRMDEKGLSQADLAEALNVSEGRVSQIFSDPGNMTLRTMIKIAKAVGLMVSAVAYDNGSDISETGPVISEVFNVCWSKMSNPRSLWDFEEEL